jgi:spoIIIJ-associated protein
MVRSVKMKGKTVEEAITSALQVLGMNRDEVEVKVLNEPEGGVLGVFGGKEAEVEVSPKLPLSEQAQVLVQEILDKMELITLVSIQSQDEDNINIEIKGEDMGRIIGRDGATIDALQHLASIIISKKQGRRIRVIVDAEGYREKRKGQVIQDADIIAKDVEKSGKEKELPPMSAADRRFIHIYIQESYPNLSSYSKGEGSERKLYIAPKSEA